MQSILQNLLKLFQTTFESLLSQKSLGAISRGLWKTDRHGAEVVARTEGHLSHQQIHALKEEASAAISGVPSPTPPSCNHGKPAPGTSLRQNNMPCFLGVGRRKVMWQVGPQHYPHIESHLRRAVNTLGNDVECSLITGMNKSINIPEKPMQSLE